MRPQIYKHSRIKKEAWFVLKAILLIIESSEINLLKELIFSAEYVISLHNRVLSQESPVGIDITKFTKFETF